MKTLRSGGNLFIEYPSVAHSLPSNEQLALIYVCCIIKPSRYNTYNRMYVLYVRTKEWSSCKQIIVVCVSVC